MLSSLLLVAANLSSLESGVIGQSAALIGDKILVAGGWSEGRHAQVDSARLYDSGRRTWSEASPLPKAKVFAAMVSIQGRALIIGGIDADLKHSKDVHSFDPMQGKWEALTPLPKPVSRVAACVWKGVAYVSGGFNGKSDRAGAANDASLLRWRAESKTWARLAPMPTARHAHCLVPFQGRLWAIGGFGLTPAASTTVESYDLASNTWRKEVSLPAERGFFGAGVLSGKLVVFGGTRNSTHPLEWSQTGWKARPVADLALRRFAYVQQGSEFLIFGGEPDGKEVHTFRP